MQVLVPVCRQFQIGGVEFQGQSVNLTSEGKYSHRFLPEIILIDMCEIRTKCHKI